MKARLLTIVVIGVALLAASVVAGEMVGTKSTGKWTKGSFAQINVGCMQAWICTAPDLLHDSSTVVKMTDGKGSAGICNAAGGDVTGCNQCSSNPPTEKCEYWLEKK
jgi:hypothetical protein